MGLSTKHVSGDHQAGFDWPSGKTTLQPSPPELPKPPLQQQTEPLKCPRCSSTNTKFCYYNNYNKSQPRHFCKSCKRHWTKGGTLRNVPVGGGRKNKRPRTSNSGATAQDQTSFPMSANTGFDKFSSLSTYFDVNNPVSYQTLYAFDQNYPGNLDSIEESIVPWPGPEESIVPWPGPDTGSTLDLPNYWNWSEIDVLDSSGHLNVSWDDDDPDIKP